jgi:hypothetical protein
MQARNIEWWLKESAVRIGSLWMPGKQVETALGRYTKQLFCLTHHNEYPYAFLGSATAVRVNNRCFTVWCRHQTKEYAPDDVTIPIEGGKTLISGSRYLYIVADESNKEEDFLDLCAMEFIPENYGSAHLEKAFFELIGAECWMGNTDATFFLFGFPTERRIVEYEVPHVHVSQVVTSGRYERPTNSQGLHCLEMTRTTKFAADGLSGGPVYHLARDNKGYFIGLAGIIMRGGESSDYIHFLDARFLTMLLKRHLNEDGKASQRHQQ